MGKIIKIIVNKLHYNYAGLSNNQAKTVDLSTKMIYNIYNLFK